MMESRYFTEASPLRFKVAHELHSLICSGKFCDGTDHAGRLLPIADRVIALVEAAVLDEINEDERSRD